MNHSNPDNQTLIFIHGAGSNSDFWHLQRPTFPEAHYIDLPGHGKQGSGTEAQPAVLSQPPSIASYADWLAGYIESNELHEVVLNGHSMGGAIALEIALRHPKWLAGLILTCSGARYPVPTRLIALLMENFEEAIDLIIAESFGSPARALTYAEKAKRYGTRRQMLRVPQEVVLGDYEACIDFDVRALLGEIDVPTLVIAGGLDRVTPPRLSRELHRGIKGSRLLVVEGEGHMLPIERPDEYNGAVAEFLVA